MAGKSIQHVDFFTLVLINKEVVSLTGEKHEHDEEDDRRLNSLVREVEDSYNQESLEEALVRKASLLAFRLATGQHFHEGNKRTALVATLAFLRMNSHSIDIKDRALVEVIDRAGMAGAKLNELEAIIGQLIEND